MTHALIEMGVKTSHVTISDILLNVVLAARNVKAHGPIDEWGTRESLEEVRWLRMLRCSVDCFGVLT